MQLQLHMQQNLKMKSAHRFESFVPLFWLQLATLNPGTSTVSWFFFFYREVRKCNSKVCGTRQTCLTLLTPGPASSNQFIGHQQAAAHRYSSPSWIVFTEAAVLMTNFCHIPEWKWFAAL
jgi:hypothetical protein